MPDLFWIDVTVSCAATVVSAALLLIALAAGPRKPVNGSFAVFMAVQFLWAFTYMGMRFALWLRAGNVQLLAEWNALFLFLTGFCVLAFSTSYVERSSRWAKGLILAGIAVTTASLPMLFNGSIVHRIRLHANGTTLADVEWPAAGFTIILTFIYIWTFILFWKDRKRHPAAVFMAYSVLALLIGFIVKGIIEVPFPGLSFAHAISIGVLGYGVLSRQLFNPLMKVTDSLKNEIVERRRAEEALTRSLHEKDLLLREIHHRVKNNLQIVTSLLKLQAERIRNRNTLAFFDDCRHRVQSMAMIHEMLYRTPNFSDVPFGEYIKKLVQSLERSYGIGSRKVRFIMRSGDLPLDLNKSIPCGLIINEIVSNALKHAFPESFKGKPVVSVSMRRNSDGRMHLMIKDNGIGFPPKALFESTRSLGMHLIRILAQDQLDGTVRMENRKGTAYHIIFPVD
jgi:two-component sensor histidine kinase